MKQQLHRYIPCRVDPKKVTYAQACSLIDDMAKALKEDYKKHSANGGMVFLQLEYRSFQEEGT